jgi:hypothetical protein
VLSDAVTGLTAVLVPGGNSSTDVPLLRYAGLAVERRGGRAHHIAWNAPVDWDSRHAFVAVRVTAALDEVAAHAGDTVPVLIGKSLASLAAPLAADRGLAAIWFTPLLTDEPTVAALRHSAAPCLLVGGTADPWWDGAVARSITPHVVEVDEADHSMVVPGPVSASTTVLGQVMDAVELFLHQIVSPPDRDGGEQT